MFTIYDLVIPISQPTAAASQSRLDTFLRSFHLAAADRTRSGTHHGAMVHVVIDIDVPVSHEQLL